MRINFVAASGGTFLISILLSVVSCRHYSKDLPGCVKDKITSFDDDSACNDIHVDQYTFQQQTVYVFEPGTCGADMTSEVIDGNCKTLGYLGGFAGNTKINGEEFSNAEFVKTVWRK